MRTIIDGLLHQKGRPLTAPMLAPIVDFNFSRSFGENAMRRLCLSLVLALVVGSATAQTPQIAPPRTWDELKAETQARADRNAYPLTGLKPDEVREALSNIRSLDRDEWARAWSAIGDRYMTKAKSATSPQAEAEDYLYAWRYYAFARWPTENVPEKKAAAKKAIAAFLAHSKHLNPPIEVVRIPFEGSEIVGYLRLPNNVRPAPLVLGISALDSRKEDSAERFDAYIKSGVGFFALDMPGTGEAPIKVDVGSERMFSKALDYLTTRPEIDAKRIAVQGNSWSGHWAARLAVVERARLKAVVVQGGPIDQYFQPAWQLKALGTREYLFDLFPARASIYGAETLEQFLAYGPRMSLAASGMIDQPSAPTLLVNGEKDTQVPIADLDILLHHGSAKEAWVNPQGGHMGRNADWPDSKIFQRVVLPWVVRQLAVAE
jgi:esterase FrsA